MNRLNLLGDCARMEWLTHKDCALRMELVRCIHLLWHIRESHLAIQEPAVVSTHGLGYDAEARMQVCGNMIIVFR